MKKWVSGFVSGLLVASVTAAGAATLMVSDASNVKFKFDGVQKSLPDGYTVLEYQGHTYVPARFVGEQLGATVTWDDGAQTVNIAANKQSNSNTNNNTANGNTSGQQSGSSVFGISTLPFTYKSQNGMQITFNKVSATSAGTVLNITLENTGLTDGDSMMTTSELMANGTKLKCIAQDKAFYDGFLSFHPGEKVTGNVTFGSLPKDVTQFTYYYSLSSGTDWDRKTIVFDITK